MSLFTFQLDLNTFSRYTYCTVGEKKERQKQNREYPIHFNEQIEFNYGKYILLYILYIYNIYFK